MDAYGSFGMGDSFFGALPIFFYIVFGLIICVFIAVFVTAISRGVRNSRSPRLTVRARVVSRREDYRRGSGNIGTGYTRYYATFEVESGDRMELEMQGEEYGLLAEGDAGSLTFQGTRYLGFDRA